MHDRYKFDEPDEKPKEEDGLAIVCSIIFFLVLCVSNVATAILLSNGNKRLEAIEQKLIEREVSPAPAKAPNKPDAEKPPRADDLGGCEVCGK